MLGSKIMESELGIINVLHQIGIKKDQTVLDFGCGYGRYAIPLAEIVGEWGKVYALDKDSDALDTLVRKQESAGLNNITVIKTEGELEIGLTDDSVDAVLLFDVFHSFFFPHTTDRRRLLGEIRRVMKNSAFLSISVWPNLIEPESEDEIRDSGFYLEKEIPEVLRNENIYLGVRIILNFRKEQRVLSLISQGRRKYESSHRSYRQKF
jgi:ubiquinone/menaquinone biosynthesis C-methylase UbiE